MIFGRLYTIIFSARVQELPSLCSDVKKLVPKVIMRFELSAGGF
jgi:hypothetical protein